MNSETLHSSAAILGAIQNESKGKFGIICLNCLIVRSRFKEIYDFMERNEISAPENDTLTKLELLDYISIELFKRFKQDPELQKKYKTTLTYIGDTIINDEKLCDYLTRFDFIAKQELIDIFADQGADWGISVYNTSEIKEYSLDLYLIKKKPMLRTEAVFLRTGEELNEENYEHLFYQISEATKVALWTVFVTTPRGVCNIGFERIINDMQKLRTWFYVVDPIHQKILGIYKGKKSKEHQTQIRDEYIQKLPHEPIRAASRLANISTYYFKESEAYKPKSYTMYELLPKEILLTEEHSITVKPKFNDIFRSLLIIDPDSGVSMISHSSEDYPADKELISGFLSAMDSFVSEIDGTTAMKEINYKGLYIHAAYGQFVKLALFLSKPAHQSLKERLVYFLNHFEKHYHDQINAFKRTANVSVFDNQKISSLIKEILSI
ncbi:MAG: hypothetical protein KAX18_05655 [Candidatus Lokiarchaeota archaeon]|nr:hypothetical protein [Candidatus Lokiarchaeota archaeon]